MDIVIKLSFAHGTGTAILTSALLTSSPTSPPHQSTFERWVALEAFLFAVLFPVYSTMSRVVGITSQTLVEILHESTRSIPYLLASSITVVTENTSTILVLPCTRHHSITLHT